MENHKINYYQLPIEDAMKTLKGSPDGLKSEDAEQRQKFYGKNELEAIKGEPLIFKLLAQFKDQIGRAHV